MTPGLIELDLNGRSPRDVYRLLIGLVIPRPIAWVTTRDKQGRANAAPPRIASAPALLECRLTSLASVVSLAALLYSADMARSLLQRLTDSRGGSHLPCHLMAFCATGKPA